ncbi:hypothetical protein [Pedobacter sp.]
MSLNKIDIDKSQELDTLEKYPERGLYIVQIIHKGHLGNFSIHYCIIKNNKGKITAYEIGNKGSIRISKDFVALVSSYGKADWGWFYVENGKLSNKLPGISKILDRLESQRIKKDFVKETNGYITFYLKGNIVKAFNYGSFVTKHVEFDFDSLDYGLYKLNRDTLKIISRNGDDILKQKNGIFFIPPPGYGILFKYSKKQILNAVDSISNLQIQPKTIRIEVDD